jgi:hypothetical protein
MTARAAIIPPSTGSSSEFSEIVCQKNLLLVHYLSTCIILCYVATRCTIKTKLKYSRIVAILYNLFHTFDCDAVSAMEFNLALMKSLIKGFQESNE